LHFRLDGGVDFRAKKFNPKQRRVFGFACGQRLSHFTAISLVTRCLFSEGKMLFRLRQSIFVLPNLLHALLM